MKLQEVESKLLPHIDAAYNLAYWITRNDQDSRDIVQEAYLRAFEFFDSLKGADAKPWILKIVRNTCYTWLHRASKRDHMIEFDEEIHQSETETDNPESLFFKKADYTVIEAALDSLPIEYREIIILREIEGLSYKEIAEVTENEMGTIMSRLSRGRTKLRQLLSAKNVEEKSV